MRWSGDALQAALSRFWGPAYQSMAAADVVGERSNAGLFDEERGGHYRSGAIDQGLAAAILLGVLLRRLYGGQRIPAILDERFIQVLRQNGLFEDCPLEAISPGAQAFFAPLQERWPVFLDSLAKPKPAYRDARSAGRNDAVHEARAGPAQTNTAQAGKVAARADGGSTRPSPNPCAKAATTPCTRSTAKSDSSWS